MHNPSTVRLQLCLHIPRKRRQILALRHPGELGRLACTNEFGGLRFGVNVRPCEDLRGSRSLVEECCKEGPHEPFVVVPDEPHGLHEFGDFFDTSGCRLGLVCRKERMNDGAGTNWVYYLPMLENAWKKLAT